MLEREFLKRQNALRNKLIDFDSERILISKIEGSIQANDEYTKINCNGYGRLRVFSKLGLHFNNIESKKVSELKCLLNDEICRTQVFQLAGCDFGCWYCFVDSSLLRADPNKSIWMSAKDILDLALLEPIKPSVIDLSGGQPELVPEWCYWVMRKIENRGLLGELTVWTDDNLSCDFFWSKLNAEQRAYISKFPGHYRTVCIKGFDEKSFSFNSGAPHICFEKQLLILEKLIRENISLEIYITMLDVPRPIVEATDAIDNLIDRLIRISPNLPFRVIPLRISSFGNLFTRATPNRLQSLGLQIERFSLWMERLEKKM
ncbi:hypothetical protein [Citrobacter portucalensis]|uniref:hypothetical protein n=1 Tax=Citrobacter portucalensis TaxID=1639133 RepID=UPI0008F88D87|nr:hypothetical protein [Citrobacter portucalensis]OIK38745.1 hypothetical protein BED30_12110 [Citrobacter portucalensis]